MSRTFFRLTMRELVRARVPHAAVFFVAALLLSCAFAGFLTFESAVDIALDLALTGSALFAAALAILLGIEIVGASATPRFHPFLASGARRRDLLAGRFSAAILTTAVLSALPPAAVLTAFSGAAAPPAMLPEVRAACVLLPLESILLVSLSAFLALAPSRPMALALSFAVWVACHLHPDPLTFEILYPGASGKLLRFLGSLLPDLELYNPRVYGIAIADALKAALAQCLVYTALGIAAASVAFSRKDLT